VLIKYNKKTWCKSGLLGFFIGLAVIVPGISGSTVAIIFKLYDQFLYALGNLFKQFKEDLMWFQKEYQKGDNSQYYAKASRENNRVIDALVRYIERKPYSNKLDINRITLRLKQLYY
jgi:hypothetical protein